jgi:hypothetical protein
MTFFFVALIGMYVGRRLGWGLSKSILYPGPTVLAVLSCIFWGGIVAVLVHRLIQWQQPGLVLKLIMGYALGAYVSIPNLGLIKETTIPEQANPRHTLISGVPLITYIFLVVAFAFFSPNTLLHLTTNESHLFQDWSVEDRENSEHLFLSIHADLESIRLSNERTFPQLTQNVQQEILQLKKNALQEARLVKDNVLNKVHPELRENFRKLYEKGLELRLLNLEQGGGNPDAENQGLVLHDKWADWFNANRDRINIPKKQRAPNP